MPARPRPLPMPPLGGVLLALACATTGLVFVWNVWPVLTSAARPAHAGHWGWVLLHGLTGTVMLITGPLNLYIGETRRWFEWHRHIGCAYIGAGYTATFAALAVNLRDPHANASIALSTTLLALAWIGAASMGWRSGARREWAAHRAWMIRSYVLVWSFVFCRIAQRGGLADLLGADGVALVVWLTWVVPLALCELALRGWRGARRA